VFEQTRDIPRALTGGPGEGDQATRRAVAWLLSQAKALGGEPLFYVPGRRNVEHDDLLLRLSKSVKTETWRTLMGSGWRGGPVLAAWPDQQKLAQIDGDRRTSALCVLTWSERDVAAWVTAHHPDVLSPGVVAPAAAALTDPVVVRGIDSLTMLVNQNNHLASTFDRNLAVAVLLTLHDGGHRLDPEGIYAHALSSGWPADGADRLKELAERVAAGKRPRIYGNWPLQRDLLQRWRAGTN
jgi:hypothetical protein